MCVCVCGFVCVYVAGHGIGTTDEHNSESCSAATTARCVVLSGFFRFLWNFPVKSMFWFTSSSCDVLEIAGDSDKKPVKEVAAEIRKKLKEGPDGEQCI